MVNPLTSRGPVIQKPVNERSANQLTGFYMMGTLLID